MHDDFTCVFSIPVKFEIYFHRLAKEIVFGVIIENKLPLYGPWKVQKTMWYGFEYSATRFLSTEN